MGAEAGAFVGILPEERRPFLGRCCGREDADQAADAESEPRPPLQRSGRPAFLYPVWGVNLPLPTFLPPELTAF